MATPTSSWSAPSPHLPAAQPAGSEEPALHLRPMGLKVHYSFDRNNQEHCLARGPHILQVQTIPLDEKTTIGVVDLRTCLQAVAQSSPEILNHQTNDYSVYAYDYSEADVPLVGQGMLSWALDLQRESQQQQLVTGRVTRNIVPLLNSGSRDTLEVKLKFTTVPRAAPRADYPITESATGTLSAQVSADTASEWNSFIQSNPMLGHASHVGAVSSPALAPAQLGQFGNPMNQNGAIHVRSNSQPPQPLRPASIPPANAMPPVPMLLPSRAPSVVSVAPRPADNAPSPAAPQVPEAAPQARASRPASRSRSKQPTGRPRGRPRKRPLETGNTSAAEEATDGDDALKKRAKVTRTEYSVIAPFGAVPESLRVAASTSGSLRAMRPVGAGGDGPAANHLQDVPRAPTPIPDGQLLQQQQRRKAMDNRARSESFVAMDQTGLGRNAVQNLSQDARSPAESIGQSPDHGYSPEDSTGDLGSSPPVPRTTQFLRSSPPPSSPVLPTIPMPMPQVDSGFMSGGLEDFFDDEDMLAGLPQDQMQDSMLPVPTLPVANKPHTTKNGRFQPQQQPNFPFQEVNPGPPELLPTKSIFNPAGKAKALNRHASSGAVQLAPKKPANRSLKRSNTAPVPNMLEQEQPLQEHPTHQSDAQGLAQGVAQPYSVQGKVSFNEAVLSEAVEPTQSNGHAFANGYTEVAQQEPSRAPALPMPIPERPEPEPVLPMPTQPLSRPASRQASRPASSGPTAPTAPPTAVPASDSLAEPVLNLPRPFTSEALCPPSDFDPPRYSKNLVKKQSIKERLRIAIEKGESPPFCNNCGAIETPTWRKIWTQDHDGVPGFHEFSDKPGCVTMIEVLARDEDEKPSKYRMVKKNLGPKDDKKHWTETILCNPCGIWLGKFKVHRPSDRWDKDYARLNQPRRKREPKGNNPRPKKARSRSDAQVNPTSEAYFTTDPIGPPGHDSPTKENYENGVEFGQQGLDMIHERPLNLRSSPRHRFPGSTHSRGSGTADSPIAVEDDLGSTRRLLFSPLKRDGVPKVLGELSLNTVQTSTHAQEAKSASAGKENAALTARPGTPVAADHDDLEQELFGTPPVRPSTPPPQNAPGPFKTPTRPTPSHRPITRSISRSIRSIRSIPKSPGQLFAAAHLQRTPSKTPRSSAGIGITSSSTHKRRTPRSGGAATHHLHAHFALDEHDPDDQLHMLDMPFDSPFTATLHQLLSEANNFITGSPSGSGGAGGAGAGGGACLADDLDLNAIASQLDAAAEHAGHGPHAAVDFESFLSTDLVMPSSPPLLSGGGAGHGAEAERRFGGAL